jgi:hypothetical protein
MTNIAELLNDQPMRFSSLEEGTLGLENRFKTYTPTVATTTASIFPQASTSLNQSNHNNFKLVILTFRRW